MIQEQAVAAAEDGLSLAQEFVEVIRKIKVNVSHVTANGLKDNLEQLVTELTEVKDWDGTGDPPATLVPNPDYKAEWITQYIEKRDANGDLVFKTEQVEISPEVLDPDTGEVITPAEYADELVQPPTLEYDEQIVRNKKFDPNVPSTIFQSTTGLQVTDLKLLTGSEASIEDLVSLLLVSAAIDGFAKSTPTGFAKTVEQTMESLVKIK